MITFSAYSAPRPLFSSNMTSLPEKRQKVISLLEQVLPPEDFQLAILNTPPKRTGSLAKFDLNELINALIYPLHDDTNLNALIQIAQASPDGRIRIECGESINPDGSLSKSLIIKFGPDHKLEQPVKATVLRVELTPGGSNTTYSVDAWNWRCALRSAAEQLSNKK